MILSYIVVAFLVSGVFVGTVMVLSMIFRTQLNEFGGAVFEAVENFIKALF